MFPAMIAVDCLRSVVTYLLSQFGGRMTLLASHQCSHRDAQDVTASCWFICAHLDVNCVLAVIVCLIARSLHKY